MDPKGPVAAEQSGLLAYTMWWAIGIGAFVSIALLVVLFLFRDKGDQKGVPEQIHGSTKLEIAWTLIPILILISVAVPTVKAAFSTYQPEGGADLTIKAVGHQWWFEFQYLDKNGKVLTTTANEMVIPVGKKVALQVTSDDVIHSFWVPKLAGKTDMIPNRINHMWLEAPEAGEYYGQCAEFCATSHAKMKFRVIAKDQASYDTWLADLTAGFKGTNDAKIAAGKALFEGQAKNKANCIACHSVNNTPANGKVGPNLTNVGGRTMIAAGVLENTEENLKAWIRNSGEIKPGSKMPPHLVLSNEELDAIVAYLKSLK